MSGGIYLDNNKIYKNKEGLKEGHVYQISFDGVKIVSGWALFVTIDNQEYLIKRNMAISNRFNRKIFKSSISLIPYIYNPSNSKTRKNFSKYGIGVGIVLSAIIRSIVPKQFIYAEPPQDFLIGISRVILFFILVVIVLMIVSLYRKKFLEKKIRNMGGELNFLGIARPLSPLQIVKDNLEVW
ncbi:hypothetical protein IAE51_11050 [Lactococcus sp. S64]|uniref:hypothetical protein n=1 Tax=Lactococcus sp. S64 TaxID=2767459 RepID=UPI0019030CE9|nr:hypothetical protein [Lactococcus sp. S64]MBK0084430.1 hypothetical protein [Lactococcus sp. S64]